MRISAYIGEKKYSSGKEKTQNNNNNNNFNYLFRNKNWNHRKHHTKQGPQHVEKSFDSDLPKLRNDWVVLWEGTKRKEFFFF